MKKWNHYLCERCVGVTIARQDDEGVTPFMLRCRAKDVVVDGNLVHGCEGIAESCFYNCSQSNTQHPNVIFYRPTPEEAIAIINQMPSHHRAGMLEHYEKGGALLKEAKLEELTKMRTVIELERRLALYEALRAAVERYRKAGEKIVSTDSEEDVAAQIEFTEAESQLDDIRTKLTWPPSARGEK